MQGLTEQTEKIFKAVSFLDCIKGYTLIGGTALSLQIGKRLSADLDFCKWSTNLKNDKPVVNWPQVQKELENVGTIEKRDILGFDQVDFVVDSVKISFFAKQRNISPVKSARIMLNNIIAADPASIGVMKIELILRRVEWRDYYDIYSLLMEGLSLKNMVDGAGNYSNHLLKTRDALNFLSNGKNYKKEKEFQLLRPFYEVDSETIEALIKSEIKKEYM